MTPVGLQIAPGLALPDDFVTQTVAILARRGAGKTYTAKVIVKEMISHNLPVVVLDPVGVWWGLRSSADGKREGLPVTILGGDHGDLPLEAASGKLVAGLVAEEPRAVVLDLSALPSKAQHPAEPMTTDEVLDQWRSALKAGARRMLAVLVGHYPNPIDRADLAAAVEMEMTGGTFQTYLGTLRRNGLIDVNGRDVVASESLFLGGN